MLERKWTRSFAGSFARQVDACIGNIHNNHFCL
jgi:hypothetical protein